MLFFSSRCEYSKRVLSKITSAHLNDLFVMANIDVANYSLPSFVDRVPLIFIIASREVVVDENVTRFLDMLVSRQRQPQQQQQPQQQGSGQLEFLSDVNKGISNTFSFIQENDDNITPLGYGFVGGNTSIPTPTGPQAQDTKSGKLDSSAFENYKTQRDKDMAHFTNSPRII